MSLARPGSKQATATKLGILSTYYLRSSIYFLARCITFGKKKKNRNFVEQEEVRLGKFPAAFFSSKCPSIAPAEMSNTPR